jgi:hypothetical protein
MRKHVYYYTHLDAPCDVASAVLAGPPGPWLPPPARCRDHGWEVTLRAEGALESDAEALPACVTVEDAARLQDGLLLPIRWRPTTAGSPLQALEADLELAPLHGHGSQLSLVGTYRPPLTVTGEVMSAPRVMEACLRSFVLAIAARIRTATLTA